MHHTELLAECRAFVVRRMEIDFRRAAKVDDALLVRSSFEQARGARMLVAQSIDRKGEVIATAMVEAAIIGLEGRPRKLPADMIARLTPFLPDSTP